jgi:2-polyprenyl-3-methyl-5-hydroxy-6-metoxy-1,4-benzoquinol methylase
MELKQTFESRAVHDTWESVYRGNTLQDRFNARMLGRILAYLRPAPGALFLDAGCGVGYHALALARHGFRCVGTDISETVLETAERNRAASGLADRVTFRCETLERLSFADATFDAVHCRGVLMHIPGWEQALAQLCRVLKPGGSMVLLESNDAAVETAVVRLLRRFRRPASRLVPTPGGLEFWAEQDGRPIVTRVANLDHLSDRLARHGVTVTRRFATEFCDINRFRRRGLRDAVIRFNQLWFALRLPPALSMGNALVGRKAS